MNILDIISYVLLLVGGIVWGLIGLFEFNPIEFFFSSHGNTYVHHHPGILAKILYLLIGISAVYQIVQRKQILARIKKT